MMLIEPRHGGQSSDENSMPSHPSVEDPLIVVERNEPQRSPLLISSSAASRSMLNLLNSRGGAAKKLYDRNEQEKELLDAYERQMSPSSSSSIPSSNTQAAPAASSSCRRRELTLISGPAGAGKTSLARSLRYNVTEKCNGYFISGKFDPIQHPESYAPFVQAFTQWCIQVKEYGPETVNYLKSSIVRTMKESIHILTEAIPALEQILGIGSDLIFVDDTAAAAGGLCGDIGATGGDISTPFRGERAQQKFITLFCRFVATICSASSSQSSHQPLVLFLDDLQWIEPASLELLSQLVKESVNIPGLFIFAAYRENEVSSTDHILNKSWSDLESNHGVQLTKINVGNIKSAATQEMISDMLGMNAVECKPISDFIFRQTQGNVFFSLQLLRTLITKGYVFRDNDADDDNLEETKGSDSSSSWKWRLEDDILQAVTCDNVEKMVKETIMSLSDQEQKILKIGACLGAEFDEYTLHEVCLTCCSADLVHETLERARDRGLLVNADMLQSNPDEKEASYHFSEDDELQGYRGGSEWQFAHDMIHQCTYSLIEESERPDFHLTIGRKLWESASEGADSLSLHLFVILNQIKFGIHLLDDQVEKYEVAVLCLKAGEKAITSSGFHVASTYLNMGIDLLGDKHWREEYHLSLALYNTAAEVDYCIGKFDRMDSFLDQVLNNAVTFRDTIRAYTTKVYALGTRKRGNEAIDTGLFVLKNLGEKGFDSTPGLMRILVDYMKTKKLCKKLTADDILNLPPMVDSDKLAISRLLVLLFHYSLNYRPLLAPIIAFRNVRLGLKHGLSGMTGVAFCNSAMLLCNGFGDIDEGCRYGDIGLKIYDRFKAKEWTARAYCAAYGFCYVWKHPLRSLLDPLLSAYHTGFSTGDIELSVLSAIAYCGIGFFSNHSHLHVLSEDMVAFHNLMRNNHQDAQLLFIAPFMQLVMDLVGSNPSSRQGTAAVSAMEGRGSSDPPTLASAANETVGDDDKIKTGTDLILLKGEYFDFDRDFKVAEDTKNEIVVAWLNFLHLLSSALFNDYTTAYQAMVDLSKSNTEAFPPHNTAYRMLLEGITSLSVEPESLQDMTKAKQCLKKIQTLVKHSPSNYHHIATLLEAEILAYKVTNSNKKTSRLRSLLLSKKTCRNRQTKLFEEVVAKYNDAAMEARDQGFVLIEAMSYERCARFHHQLQLQQQLRQQHLSNSDEEQDCYETTIRPLLVKSQSLYDSWGAHSKARQVVENLL